MSAAAWGKALVIVALSAIAGFGLVTALVRFRSRVTRLERHKSGEMQAYDGE